MNEQNNQQETEQVKGQDLLRSIGEEQLRDDIPQFSVGDTVEVGVTIEEGETERVQNFTGICICRKGGGIEETFTVRRIVQGEGVERIFPLHCPSIDHISVERKGKARRAKLNYLRERQGRSARVRERFDAARGEEGEAEETPPEE